MNPAHPYRTQPTTLLLWSASLFAAAMLLLTGPALASDIISAVNFENAKNRRTDGMLREWPEMQKLGYTVSGPSGRDPAAKGLVGYDDKYLYVGMDIVDSTFVRTRSFGAGEDVATLLLAFPKSGGGYRTYFVELYPGDPGKTPGVVKIKHGSKISGAKLVEMELDGGMSFEASIPWSVFPEAKQVRVGLRAALRYADADTRGKTKSVIATSKASSGTSLPPMLLEGEYSLYHGLIYDKQLSEKPDKVLVGNVAGSPLAEQVALYGRYLTIVGPGYRGGTQFYFQDTAVERVSDVTRLQLTDLTGDGKQDIVIQKKVGTKKVYREILQVWSIASGDEPHKVFEHEVGIRSLDGSISNAVSIKGSKITVSQGKYDGFDPAEYKEHVAGGGMEPAFLPWQKVQYRTYEYKGGKFEMVDEKLGKPRVEPATKGRRFGHAPAPGSAASIVDGESGGASGEPPPRPRPPTAAEKMDQVYALYRRDRGVPKSKPRFDFVTDVAEDEDTERVLVHGKDIVAFGRSFKRGESYVYITMGFKKDSDVLAVTARDMTGDGKAEVIVRGVIEATASKALGGDTIARHALFIYKITPSGITRIFAAETGRSLGKNAILGNVVFRPAGKGVVIELGPGRAVGWTKDTYPFPPDQHPYAGLEPLLLPWTDMDPRKYGYSGRVFSQR